MAEVMAKLAAMEKELERANAENLMLREALVTPKDDEDETEKPEAEDAARAPAMPESFLMIPKKPPGFAQGKHESERTQEPWRWTAEADPSKFGTPLRPIPTNRGYDQWTGHWAEESLSKSAAPTSDAWDTWSESERQSERGTPLRLLPALPVPNLRVI